MDGCIDVDGWMDGWKNGLMVKNYRMTDDG